MDTQAIIKKLNKSGIKTGFAPDTDELKLRRLWHRYNMGVWMEEDDPSLNLRKDQEKTLYEMLDLVEKNSKSEIEILKELL